MIIVTLDTNRITKTPREMFTDFRETDVRRSIVYDLYDRLTPGCVTTVRDNRNDRPSRFAAI